MVTMPRLCALVCLLGACTEQAPPPEPVSLEASFDPAVVRVMRIHVRFTIDGSDLNTDVSLEADARYRILKTYENGDADFELWMDLKKATSKERDLLTESPSRATIRGRADRHGKMAAGTASIEGTPQAKDILGGFSDGLDSIGGEWPERPVSEGESWELPFDADVWAAGLEGEKISGKTRQTFERVVEVDGTQCAVIRTIADFRVEDGTFEGSEDDRRVDGSGSGDIASILGFDGHPRGLEARYLMSLKIRDPSGEVTEMRTTLTLLMTGTVEPVR